MSVRQLSFLQRKRISRSDLQIRVESRGPAKQFWFSATLDSYGLPGDSRIVVDARQMQVVRRHCGTIAQPQARVAHDISSLHGDNISFNLYVIDPRTSRKLAECLGVRPDTEPDSIATRMPLLPVDGSQDLRGEVWRVDYETQDPAGATDAPVLKVDRRACAGSAASFLQRPLNAGAVLPAAMREILAHVLFYRRHSYDPSGPEWTNAWIRMAERYACEPAPFDSDGNANLIAAGEWLQLAVSSFAQSAGFLEAITRERAE